MFAFNYGNYNGAQTYNPSPATTRAISDMVRANGGEIPDQVGWSNPELPAQGRFLNGMQQAPRQARQAMAQQAGTGQLPPGYEDMPLDEFLQAVMRARRGLPSRPQPRQGGQNGQTGQSSPLDVHAHAYQDGNGNTVPVASVVISEAGNWSSRERTYNPAHNLEVDANYRRAQLNKYYNVTTTWEDGRTQTTQVRDQGYAVEVW